jgi:hypothetical protein
VRLSRFAVLCATFLVGVASCHSIGDPSSAACEQTYEFGNYGCARVLVTLSPPSKPWPLYRVDVRLRAAEMSMDATLAVADDPPLGEVPVTIVRWSRPPAGAADTMSVWVIGKMLEIPSPIPVGVPLPTFAADSVLRVLHFAPVGAVPATDSLVLVLRTKQ